MPTDNCTTVGPDGHRGMTLVDLLGAWGFLSTSGAWCYETNSNQMLALRCAKYNGPPDQVFLRYQQRLRETSE